MIKDVFWICIHFLVLLDLVTLLMVKIILIGRKNILPKSCAIYIELFSGSVSINKGEIGLFLLF